MQSNRLLFLATFLLLGSALRASQSMDKDLLEVSVPGLEQLYAAHKHSVTQVVHWYLARIEKYNWIYRAIEHVDGEAALAVAEAEDAAAKHGGRGFQRGPLWGIPIVIKENTSIKGLVTSDGWRGFLIPDHELIAPQDATVVSKLRAAGAIIIGQTNMPDFAASDTNRSTAFGRTGNAYDVRFSPGGSSGGTVTAITANFAVLGTGTDTSNSIRMPSSTSAVIGLLPTRGLVSIAGIAALDWLLDNTGPIARNVSDAAIALSVMAGEDAKDFRTGGSAAKAEAASYTRYLKADSLKGKRFGVPAFIMNDRNLRPETRELFLRAIEALRTAGASVIADESILTDSSVEEYQATVGSALPSVITRAGDEPPAAQKLIETDPAADSNFFAPQRTALAAYLEPFDRLHLDALVYPAAQMPPPDETMPQDGLLSSGPHSSTGWVNRIGVPAIVVVGGFYHDGLHFGVEISTRPWKDGDLLGWAFAYEQATKFLHPPVLVSAGLVH